MVDMFAKDAYPVEEVRAGDIGTLVSLPEAGTGDTLCDSTAPAALERIRFPPSAISVSVKPKNKGEQERFRNALGEIVRADPSLQLETDREMGQPMRSY
jgi:elongation factor G